MKSLVIIPARGGSKRLPDKNIKELAGKPLIFHTIDCVKDLFDSVIVSSDSKRILSAVNNEYSQSNLQVSLRPERLSTDTSKVIDTVSYYYKSNSFDQVWLCLPTCPLRTKDDVIMAQNLLTKKCDGVVSVTEYEFPPSLGLLEGSGGYLTGYHWLHPFATGDSRSQDHQTVYRPNGAIYGMWWNHFGNVRNFYKGKIVPYKMPRSRSIDIDTQLDFDIASVLCEQEK